MSVHRHNEARQAQELLPRLRSGETLALVSDAGLPGVNDPGARLVEAALGAGVDVTVLPGPSAVETALVASGLGTGQYRFLGYLPRRAAELEACDLVNVKVAGAGGFKPARELMREARSAGMDVFLSSTLDGPWGIAAALQLAAAEELTLACGLATLSLFDSPLARALPAPRAGTISVPTGPGLGVSIEEEDIDAVTLETVS